MKLNTTTLKTALTFSLFIVHCSFVYAQTCNDNAPETTPTSDFTVNNDGTVTHNATGLMWKVCSEGMTWNAVTCNGSATSHTWQEALQVSQTLNAGAGYAGYTDWRLPNIKELKSIVELQCSLPAINEAIFNNTPSTPYWSSSPAYFGSASWAVTFSGGFDEQYVRSSDGGHVRLVRSGQ